MLRLFLQGNYPTVTVEFGHTVSLRILDMVDKDGRPLLLLLGMAEQTVKIMAVEDVIAQDQGRTVAGKEIPPDEQGLGQSTGRWLEIRRLKT